MRSQAASSYISGSLASFLEVLVVDLVAPLLSICPHTHGRVLNVLADAERPLSGNEIARRAGLSPGGAMAALDDLVAAGVVWRAKLSPLSFLHVLYEEHVLAPLVLEFAAVGQRLRERIAAHVADWTPAPATVATATPLPSHVDERGRAMVGLLVAVDDVALLEDPEWCGQVDALAEAVWHWTGNRAAVTQVRTTDQADELTGQGSEEGQAATWLLVAGRPIGRVATPSEPDQWVGPLPRSALRQGASPSQ